MISEALLLVAAMILEPAPIPTPAATPITQEAPIEVGIGSGKSFAFDWDGNSEDGTPHDVEIRHVRFRYMPPGTDPTPLWINVALLAPLKIGENRIPVSAALSGIPAGEYDMEVQIEDTAGQKSAYSMPALKLRVRVKNPTSPTNVRVVGP